MILSNWTIAERLKAGELIENDVDNEQIQPASLDVRLGPKTYDTVKDTTFHWEHEGEVTLEPNTPYIGHTVDVINMPDDVAAMLTGRSSVGRRGVIVHKTAGWIDPGFRGQLTLEMYNFSEREQTFAIGERVGQLVFFQLDKAAQPYDGQYQDQEGITA